MSTPTTAGATDRMRAPDRRPRAVLLDIFETVLHVDALRSRFVDVGRPEHECELFFARALRDGMALARARIPVYGFTHGSEPVACEALDKAGLRTYLRDVLSTERIGSFKPPARVYHWACAQLDLPPEKVALVAVHSWDVHGAVRAGLVGGLATRLEGAVPDVVERPHVVAERLDTVVDRLVALPV